jgi:hypothetical protein
MEWKDDNEPQTNPIKDWIKPQDKSLYQFFFFFFFIHDQMVFKKKYKYYW